MCLCARIREVHVHGLDGKGLNGAKVTKDVLGHAKDGGWSLFTLSRIRRWQLNQAHHLLLLKRETSNHQPTACI